MGRWYTGLTIAIGLAATNTGNNLLFLVLGLLLASIVVSGILSEQSLKGVRVERRLPAVATAGQPALIGLLARNGKGRAPSFSLEIREARGDVAGRGFLILLPARQAAEVAYRFLPQRRGVHRFEQIEVATRAPFGLFEKSRPVDAPAELVVFPRQVPAPPSSSGALAREGERPQDRIGLGLEVHSLRDHRAGEDARSIHWKSSARAGRLIGVDREQERRKRVCVMLDQRPLEGEPLERAVEVAAALVTRELEGGAEVSVALAGQFLPAASGEAHRPATFAFTACAVSGELGPPMVAFFPLALAGSLFLGQRVQGKAEWAWTALLGGALLLFAVQVGAGQLDIVLGAARFAELLCIHRLWHRRSERDELWLLLLSLLLLCAGAALAAELTFGLAFLGFAVSGTWAMALTHLRFEIEAGRGPAGSAALLNSRRVATPALLGGLAALATLGIVGAAVVFFIFPRVTIGGMRRASRPSPVAGLGDRVDLARAGTVADDPRVALRVRLDPPPPGEPRDLAMHWRARSLSRWTGQGWQAQDGGIIPATRLPPRPRLGRPPALLSADVEVVGTFGDGIVFTPEGWPLSVDFRRPGSARPAAQRLYRNAAGDLFYQPVDGNDL